MFHHKSAAAAALIFLLGSSFAAARPLAIVGATIIDGTGRAPIENGVVVVDDGRIVSVGERANVRIPSGAKQLDGAGKYVIPGLMDANVHLLLDVEPEYLLKAEFQYEPLILEAAQIALKHGVTTVFDTWGPRAALVNVRNQINAGQALGSRIFLAGNIIGFGGPMSPDFVADARKVISTELADRIDHEWEQGVGEDLLWRTPEQVGARVRDYIANGNLDFVKYGSSGHVHMQFIAFSLEAQRAIVKEAHRAGITAQAHTSSPESLRMAIEAGVDLLQHCDLSGPEPLPMETIERIAREKIPCPALIVTDANLEWNTRNVKTVGVMAEFAKIKDINQRNLIKAGAMVLLSTDAGVVGPHISTSPLLGPMWADTPDLSIELGEAHFLWLQGAQERGMSPMNALLAATRDIAIAYKKDAELGTLETGKRADLVVLDADPLADVRNYRRIHHVMKDGKLVDRDSLPSQPVLTAR